jgi:LPS-assembly protein
LIFSILCPPYVTHAKMVEVKVEEKEGPVDIEADQLIYEKDQQLYQAHGQVEVTQGNLFLKADHAHLHMATKDLVAWGNVVLREGEDVLECERLEINLNTQMGKIYQARLFLKDQNFHITGREVEKLGEKEYRVRDGSFTTCDAKRPPWKFTVREMEVTLGGYGIAKGPVFYMEDIPILYLPAAIFPVISERQTGFLLPRVGYSKQYGPELKTAFFWAITKDMDATLYLDWLGDRGFKEGLEYRYALTRDTAGRANFHFIDDQEYHKNRYAFFWQHQQKFPYDLYLKGDINYVSDHQYTHDFDEDLPQGAKIDSRSSRQLRSTLFGGKNWDQYSFLAEGWVYDDLTKESNDETVQKLPQVSFYAHPQSLFKNLFFYDLTSSYTHFWREKGVKAQRGDLFPRFSLPVRLFNVLKLEPNIGLRGTFYKSYDDPTHQFQGWESRETLEAGVNLSTELYRLYDVALTPKISRLFSVNKWMHTIEPFVGYLYSPRVDQNDLPIFDEVDRIPYTHQITYGFTQRLIGKSEKEGMSSSPHEYGRLKIFQSYSLGDPYETDSKGKGRYFSNIQGELSWNFSSYVSAQLDGEFNPYDRNFYRFNTSILAKDRRNDAIQIGYLYTENSIEAINGDARVKVLDPLYLFGGIRYDLLQHWRVESIYGVEYQAQCWTLGLMVEDRNRSPDGTQSKELKFEVYFRLLGLGAMGKKPYFMSF